MALNALVKVSLNVGLKDYHLDAGQIWTRCARSISTSQLLNRTFHEPYKRPLRYQAEEKPTLYHLKQGSKLFWPEFKKFVKEIKDNARNEKEEVMSGDHQIFWSFKTQEDVDKWVVTADSDHAEGYSTCNLVSNKNQNALFSGVLNVRPPKDGVVKRAGYCNMRLPSFTRSFKRTTYLDWTNYSHLILRVRGDGRTYSLNIYTEGEYDVEWHDGYYYPLYTRGGPHWQNVKVPLARFVFASKGVIQNDQNEIPCDTISSFGITMADRINGPFSLEIESIGVYSDPCEEACDGEQSAFYDLYTIPTTAPG